jgi:hypothetical protein
MKLTNRSGLPQALLNAVQNDPYDKGAADFSVTELLKPARQAALQRLHHDEIEEDVEDRLYSLYGQVAHVILERANHNAIAEKRYFGLIDGVRVSAQLDTLDLDGGTLSDWKFTTAWGFKADKPVKPEWVAQLNMQLELLRQNGLDAKALQIVGLIRDFSKPEARRDPAYPQVPVVTVPMPMWERQKTVAYMRERIILHTQARLSLPKCSEEERWAKPTIWAVKKKGNQKAERGGLHTTEAAALAHAAKDKNFQVEFRPGENTRCELYCNVAEFCSQFNPQKEPSEASEGVEVS